jgi:DNA modification methylase
MDSGMIDKGSSMSIDSGYEQFITSKIAEAPARGFDLAAPTHPSLFPHQRDIVQWACKKGRAAIFAAFGLGKSRMQIEVARQTLAHVGPGARFLIVAPLGVRQEFLRDAAAMDTGVRVVRSDAEVDAPGVYLSHYEPVRDGKLNPQLFAGVSLDEASCLRGFGGTKTFREFMATMAGDDRRDMSQRIVNDGVRYRFVATATPSPNEFIELLAYAAFLDVMTVSAAKTRFFQRDSEKADNLTIHPHKVREFWHWVSSWGVFVTKPSDISPDYSDDGYVLPDLDVQWHEVQTNHLGRAGEERSAPGRMAQRKMFVDGAAGVTDAARESRASMDARVAKLMEIRAAEPGVHRVVWHDLEDERRALEKAIPEIVSVYGAQDVEDRMTAIVDFAEGRVEELAAKPVMLGSGVNFQRHCHEAVFLSIGYKFNDFIQAVHRIHRFLQPERVRVHIIYTEGQREIRRSLERKWAQHNELVAKMTGIVREHGLANARGSAEEFADKVTCDRQETSGSAWCIINNDCVDETRGMEPNSVGLIVTSVPFSTQYKYSDSYRDFGHTDTNEHFFSQMDYLTPHLLRVLQPGRMACIHVKDRIVPGGMNGMGFQTVYPFHADCIAHYTRHGFAYMGMITVVTDVVRENNQTYRLSWSEQVKDATKMSVGMPEYVLLFRKPPTSSEKSYADVPVERTKENYTLGRWQTEAHAFWRSSGDRFITIAELDGLEHAEMFRAYARASTSTVYDHEAHVKLCEELGARGKLPTDFMLFQPQSHSPEVWTDVARMRTMNTLQAQQERVQHLCPMQFDIADRLINRFSLKGEVVFDPFSGLGTVPYSAVKHGRRGLGTELSPVYYGESLRYLRALDREQATPTLFDLAGLR